MPFQTRLSSGVYSSRLVRIQRQLSCAVESFLKSAVALAATAELGQKKAHALVRAHNWGKYDFGSGPEVRDRLNQGPFPQFPPDQTIPSDEVVMTTIPSEEAVPNYGKGLVTYITADMGTEEIKSDNVSQAIEDLVRFPLGQQLYIRPTWREIQPQPGQLQLPDYLKQVFDLAKKNDKRIGMRVQMSAPDYWHAPALPQFVLDKVPMVDLVMDPHESPAQGARFLKNPYSRSQPRFDHPFFQQSFKELVGQLAAEFNGNPSIEFIDTFMYGFWGEGHTWPFGNNLSPIIRLRNEPGLRCGGPAGTVYQDAIADQHPARLQPRRKFRSS